MGECSIDISYVPVEVYGLSMPGVFARIFCCPLASRLQTQVQLPLGGVAELSLDAVLCSEKTNFRYCSSKLSSHNCHCKALSYPPATLEVMCYDKLKCSAYCVVVMCRS